MSGQGRRFRCDQCNLRVDEISMEQAVAHLRHRVASMRAQAPEPSWRMYWSNMDAEAAMQIIEAAD